MASAPRPGVTARQEAERAHVTFELDDVTYTVWMGEVGSNLGREFRQQTGMSWRTAIQLIGEDPDLDLLQSMIWLARRQAGEHIKVEDVPELTYENTKTLRFVEEPAEDEDSPEP